MPCAAPPRPLRRCRDGLEQFDAFLIFDADNLPDKDYVNRTARVCAAPPIHNLFTEKMVFPLAFFFQVRYYMLALS